MQFFNQPMSQEQKRLRLRDAMKLIMEGEDIEYIQMKIRETFPANLSKRDLKGIAFNIAILSQNERDALVREISPDRFNDRHLVAALIERDQRAEAARNQMAKQADRTERLERAGAASQLARKKWTYRFERLKLWLNAVFWISAAVVVVYIGMYS